MRLPCSVENVQPQDLSQRAVGPEADLPDDPRGVQEMDHADPPLEAGPEPLRDTLWGPFTSAGL